MKFLKKLKKVNLVQTFGLDRFKMPAIIGGAIALFIFTNVLLAPISLKLDLTKGKAYTLTDSTKKIIRELDKPLKITFYVSSDVPTQLRSVKRDITDFLNEYESQSGKVDVEVKDPQKDTQAQKEVAESGLQQIPFRVYEQNKMQAVQGYFGIVVSYDKAQEIIPEATDISSLEYNITSTIYKLTKKELPQIAIIGPEVSFIPQQDPLATFKTVAGQQFNFVNAIQPIETPEGTEPTDEPQTELTLSNNHKTLMVFDTNIKEYTEEEIAKIKEYIANKGNVIFIVSGVWVNDQMTATQAAHGLFALLREYGIDVKKNVLLSFSSELINYGNETIQISLPYPMWVKTSEFNEESSYFANIAQLMYLWSSSLELTKANGYEARPLVMTTAQSWQQTSGFILDPQQIQDPTEEELKEFIVTAEATKKDAGKVMVIASNRFLEDRYLSRNSSNIEFVLNVLNEYASDGALQGIRRRQVELYPLPELNEAGKEGFKYLNMLLLPGLFALYGVIRLMKRR